MINIERHRKWFREDETLGELFLNGKHFCYTLEDTVRAEGVKIPGKTAIPKGEYDFTITFSPRFKRDMILFYNVGYDLSVLREGISFTGVRIHGGNNKDHTEGCPLVAYNHDVSKGLIWGTAEKDLLEKVKEQGDNGKVTIKHIF